MRAAALFRHLWAWSIKKRVRLLRHEFPAISTQTPSGRIGLPQWAFGVGLARYLTTLMARNARRLLPSSLIRRSLASGLPLQDCRSLTATPPSRTAQHISSKAIKQHPKTIRIHHVWPAYGVGTHQGRETPRISSIHHASDSERSRLGPQREVSRGITAKTLRQAIRRLSCSAPPVQTPPV